MTNLTRDSKIMQKEICPCCGSNMWIRKKIDLMNDYLICNNCGLNFQEIPKNISNDEFFKIQQEHYFSDSDMLDSKLMIAVETEENKTNNLRFEKPESDKEIKLVSPDNLDELIHYLHNEAKVI